MRGRPDDCACLRLLEGQSESLLKLIEKGMTEAFSLLLVPARRVS